MIEGDARDYESTDDMQAITAENREYHPVTTFCDCGRSFGFRRHF